MMQVAFDSNPRSFLEKCGSWLAQNEVEHNLILSLCQSAEQKIKKGEVAEIRCGALFNGKDPILAAVQTPPRNLVLSKSTQPEIDKLVEMLVQGGFSFPGIVGPSDVASAFANKWAQATGRRYVEYMDHIIYVLHKVMFPPPVKGELRAAKPEEADLLSEWITSFAKDAKLKTEQLCESEALQKAGDMIAAGSLMVWSVKGKPVAQASVSGTDSVARISMVYTPPEHRGQGYASAVVAHTSQLQLDRGRKMCCLYADARNTVSNSIYRKIGYEFVGRSSMYVLEKAA